MSCERLLHVSFCTRAVLFHLYETVTMCLTQYIFKVFKKPKMVGKPLLVTSVYLETNTPFLKVSFFLIIFLYRGSRWACSLTWDRFTAFSIFALMFLFCFSLLQFTFCHFCLICSFGRTLKNFLVLLPTLDGWSKSKLVKK